jgi:hypothetical protein
MSRKNDFSPSVIKKIKKLSGYCCANPACRIPVVDKHSNKVQKTSGFGQVAHIYSASSNKKLRPLPKSINKIFLTSIENAMLLCSNCHIDIDYDGYHDIYIPELLLEYKDEIEYIVRTFLFKVNKKYEKLNNTELMMLQDEILKSKRIKNFNISSLSHDEVIFLNLQHAIHKINVNLDINEYFSITNLEKIELDFNKVNFGRLDEKLKKNIKGKFTIAPFKEVDLMITARKNKKFNIIIENCIFNKDGNKYTTKRSFFNENHSFFNIVTLTYELDLDEFMHGLFIETDMNLLKNIHIKELTDLDDLSSLLEILVNDKIIISWKDKENDWIRSLDYEYNENNVRIVKKDLIDQVNLLSTLLHIAKTQNIDISYDKILFKKIEYLKLDCNFFYNTIVNQKIPNFFILNSFNVNKRKMLKKIDDISCFTERFIYENINNDINIVMMLIYNKINIQNFLCETFEYSMILNKFEITINIKNSIIIDIQDINKNFYVYGIKTNNSQINLKMKKI